MFFVPRTAYAYVAILLLVLWPLLLLIWWSGTESILLVVLLVAASVALLVFVWKRCSSEACSLLLGFKILSVKWSCGCANISIVYVPVALVGVYFVCLSYALGGHESAQMRWLEFVSKFVGTDEEVSE